MPLIARHGKHVCVIIVSGSLDVEPAERAAYLESCVEVIVAARQAPGCVNFHLSADAIDPGRVNVFEQWESVSAVEVFRGSGPSSEQTAVILSATVHQHEISQSTQL